MAVHNDNNSFSSCYALDNKHAIWKIIIYGGEWFRLANAQW